VRAAAGGRRLGSEWATRGDAPSSGVLAAVRFCGLDYDAISAGPPPLTGRVSRT
jgi:hypothetical protein